VEAGTARRVSTVTVSGEEVPSPLFVAGVLVILLGVAGFWVLGRNLGSGEAELDDVRARVRSFAEYMADGDGERACSMMEPGMADAFVARAAQLIEADVSGCSELVAELASARPSGQSTELRGVTIVDVRIVQVGDELNPLPDRAEVDVGGGTVILRRTTGCAGAPRCWQVTDGGPLFRLAATIGSGATP
jgi:hypothetical protein